MKKDKKMIFELLQKPIAFHRAFVDITGSLNAGLLLSHLFNWQPRDGRPFYKTIDDVTKECALTRHEQAAAKKTLVSKGLLEIVKQGLPAKNYYRIDLDKLYDLLTTRFGPVDKYAEIRSTGQPKNGVLHTIGKIQQNNTAGTSTPHHELMRRWCDRWQAVYGEKYIVHPGDAATVKRLLSTLTPDDIMSVAEYAWGHPKKWECEKARSLRGLGAHLNEIRAMMADKGHELPSRDSYIGGEVHL